MALAASRQRCGACRHPWNLRGPRGAGV